MTLGRNSGFYHKVSQESPATTACKEILVAEQAIPQYLTKVIVSKQAVFKDNTHYSSASYRGLEKGWGGGFRDSSTNGRLMGS